MKPIRTGFTLIETVITLALLAVVAFGMGSFILSSIQGWVLISQRESAVTIAKSAMNRMTAELRRIRTPQDILIHTNSQCRFVDISNQTIDFVQSGTNLLRNSDVLATGLSSPEGLRFTFVDATGESTSVHQEMRSIRVLLSVISGRQMTTLESSARIRNF